MNDVLQACLLGLLQGFTEFLPVSSSAHLILLPKLMGWQDFGLSFDIAIHFGSLFAILVYFFKNRVFKFNYKNLLLICIATIPVGLSGLLCKNFVAHYARSIALIATTTIIFGILLGVSDLYNKHYSKHVSFAQLTIGNAVLIGLAQAVAIIPGVSRSGVTLTAGLALGLSRQAAAGFSFLLAIPVIFLASAVQVLDVIFKNNLNFTVLNEVLISGFLSSMFSSFIFIFIFLKFINKISMWWFVLYRVILGSMLWLTI